MLKSEKAINILTIVVGGIISCFVAFDNKFPLVYSDTGAYIYSGFNNAVLDDRPIFYGLFIRHMSLGVSPWLVVFIQALICSYLIYRTFQLFIEQSSTRRNILFLLSILGLTLLTGYSHNVSIMLPDIFSAIGILAFLHLLLNDKLVKFELIILALLFSFSLMVHLSNLVTVGILLFLLLIPLLRKKKIFKPRRYIYLSLIFALTFFALPSLQYLIGGKYQYAKIGHVFQINHLIENGILKKYLDENCGKKDFELCKYKDDLSWNFIWSENSVLHKTGGWNGSKKEYSAIIRDIYTSPSYWSILFQKSTEYGLRQFFSFETFSHHQEGIGSPPYVGIEQNFPDASREYLMSKQANGILDVYFLNKIEVFVICISILICFFYIFYQALSKQEILRFFASAIILFSLINSFVCSNLSSIDTRYQNRIVWLFVLLAIFIVCQKAWNFSLKLNLKENHSE